MLFRSNKMECEKLYPERAEGSLLADAASEAHYCTTLCRQLLEEMTFKYQIDGPIESPAIDCLGVTDVIRATEQGRATLDWICAYPKIVGRLNILFDYIVRADDALGMASN